MLRTEGKSSATARLGSRGRRRGRSGPGEMGLYRAWHFLASMKLAMVLIFSIAAFTLAGTLIDQAPASVLGDHLAYQQWLNRAAARYGGWTDVMDRLQLFNVFHSVVFRTLLGLLTVSIVVCTMSRWRAIWNTTFHTRVRMTEAFFSHARYNAQFVAAMPADEAAERVRKVLAGSRYRVKKESSETSVAVFGDRNRFSRFGTFLSHLAIVLILIGAIVGGIWGFKDPEFIVAEGATRDLGLGTNISVRLDHFADEYYVDGPPKDYRSDVVLLDHGKEVKSGTIRVNSPLRYKGIAFHLAFFGQSAVMKVQDAAGTVFFEDNVPLAGRTNDGLRPVGYFEVPGHDLTAFIIGPASGADDPAIPAGEMRVELFNQDASVATPANLIQGTPAAVAGLTFTFERESRFSGLKVVKDPGVNIIWAAGALMFVGLVALFYLPPRRLWALCIRRADGTTEVRLAMPAQRDFALDSEFERMRERVRNALGDGPGDPAQGGNHA